MRPETDYNDGFRGGCPTWEMLDEYQRWGWSARGTKPPAREVPGAPVPGEPEPSKPAPSRGRKITLLP